MTIFLIGLCREIANILLLGWILKGIKKSHDHDLTHSTRKPRSWPHALKGLTKRIVSPKLLTLDILLMVGWACINSQSIQVDPISNHMVIFLNKM